MADCSPKSNFKSRFAPGEYVSAAQYLAENMCDRKARSKGTALPARFWKVDGSIWKREFLQQVRHANALLKAYSVEAIIRALRTKEGKRIYSFGATWLDPIIKAEQEALDRQKAAAEATAAATPPPLTGDEVAPVEKPRPAFVPGASPLTKLRNLD